MNAASGTTRRHPLRSIALGSLVAIVAIAIVVALSVDAIAARVIASEGTAVIGARTSVSSVHIALLGGTSSVSGLEVAQPSGFGEGAMLGLDRTTVTLRLPALLGKRIEIDEVTLGGLKVALVSKDGKLNLETVAGNVQKSMADQPAPGKGEEAAPGKEVLIRRLVVTDIDVTAIGTGMTVTGNPVKVRIPDITLENVSSANAQESVTSEVTSQVLQAVVAGVLKSNIEGLSSSALAGLNSAGGTLESAIGQFGTSARAAADKLAEGLQGTGKGLQGAGKDIEKGLDGIGNGIKGIFGGDKSETPKKPAMP